MDNPSPTNNTITVRMTSDEVAQLIHASVDSSFAQKHQNFSSLTILIPSRVNKKYQYHPITSDGVDSSDLNTGPHDLPRIPFTYKTRGYGERDIFDAAPSQIGEFPSYPAADGDVLGVTGFVRSFNTTIVPGQPFIEFSLEFEQATVPFGGGTTRAEED